MSQSNDQALRQRIDQFVDEISDLVRAAALDAVRAALGGTAPAPVRRGPGRPPKTAGAKPAARKKGKRIRRTGADLEKLSGDILAYVQSNPGGRLGDIAKALNVDTKDARRPAFALLEEGRLKTEGQRGGTRYYPAGSGGARSTAKKTSRKTAKKATKTRRKAKARK